MKTLLAKFKKYISTERLIEKGDGLVVAVSGGVDSMVLLDLLHRISGEWNPSITVAHVNHGLRGSDSAADENLVKNTAERYGLRFESIKRKPPKGKNVQNAARDIRLKFLMRTADEVDASAIATAHHMNDQAETILLHLLRGSGLTGLSGMRPSAEIEGHTFIRPLLETSREDIKQYAKKNRIRFREDRTNRATKYSRNLIRHRLMPLLLEFNPKILEHLSQMAKLIGNDEDALELIGDEFMCQALIHSGKDLISFSREALIGLPKSLRMRIFRSAFRRVNGSAADLNSDQLEKMDHIAKLQNAKGTYRLPSRWKFERSGNVLAIRRCSTSHDR